MLHRRPANCPSSEGASIRLEDSPMSKSVKVALDAVTIVFSVAVLYGFLWVILS